MRIPDRVKDTKNQAILAALVTAVILVLYISHGTSPKKVATADNLLGVPPSFMASGSFAPTLHTTASSSPKVSTPSVHLATQLPTTAPGNSQLAAEDLTISGGKLLKSLVNIVCLSGDNSIPSISGSGIIIDSRGIILTAAHVAQFFLLQDYLGPNKVTCLVRTGSPARRAYFAEPIYVSPAWIRNNLQTISTTNPKGTGENDFALLAITTSAISTPVPDTLPSVPLSHADPTIQEPIAIGSYGAQYLSADQVNYDLYPILVFGSIQNRYTYGGNNVDVVSIAGSAASQEGSSGGGITNSAGELQGIITTSSVAGDISTRLLNVITLRHIRRSYAADTGLNLDATINDNSLSTLIASFANESKALGQQLTASIGASSH
jgi:hypothetical protein